MLPLHLAAAPGSRPTILCLGAHGDDIEIGCGGTVLRLVEAHPDAAFHWVVFSGEAGRAEEAWVSAHAFLEKAAAKRVVVKSFRDSFFPFVGGEIKEYFEQLKQEVSPDVIFTHYRNDLHQDHRLIAELTWNTFRGPLILEYEIPKFDGDLGSPNLFVHLDEAIGRQKARLILDTFTSQRAKPWFSEETFLGLLALRGVESNAPARYAEGFYGRKLLLGLGARP
jgi:LmbE family N-acetylglucosaminyl deacetylase